VRLSWRIILSDGCAIPGSLNHQSAGNISSQFLTSLAAKEFYQEGQSPQTPVLRNITMDSAVTQPKLYIPISERRAKTSSVSKAEPTPKVHFWRIGGTIRKQGDGEWIFFVLFGMIALLVTIPAFVTLKWKFTTNGAVTSPPAIGADGTIYFGSSDFRLYAVNPDGTPKWAIGTNPAPFSSPAVGADGTIYIGSNDGHLYAVNPDGTLKWKFPTAGLSSVTSSPAIGADGTIYVGSNTSGNGALYAVNPDSTRKWAFGTGNEFGSSPAIGGDGTIYIGSGNFNFYAVNPADGTQKWAFPTNGSVQSSPAIGVDGTIYFGSDDGNLYAVN
jgi:outer membrane protein assembly factor BamB